MTAVEELETIQNCTEMEEVEPVLPKSPLNEHETDNMDVKDGHETDLRPEEAIHPPEVSQVHVATGTAPSPGKDKAPSKKTKPLSSPPRIHRTLPSLLIGDLVWARVSSKAQWWPAMVAYDPQLVQYFRHRAADKRLEYHLQWFGKGARRSWVSVALLDPMVSADQHPLLQKTGEVALRELKVALSLSRRERRLALTFDYGSKRPLPAVGGGKRVGKGKDHCSRAKRKNVEPILPISTSTTQGVEESSSEDTHTAALDNVQTSKLEHTHNTTLDNAHTSTQDSTHTSTLDDVHISTQDSAHTSTLDDVHTSTLDDVHTSTLDDAHTSTLDDAHTSTLDDAHTSTLDDVHTSTLDDAHTSTLDDVHTSTLDDAHTSTLDDTHTSPLDGAHTSSLGDAHTSTLDDTCNTAFADVQTAVLGDTHSGGEPSTQTAVGSQGSGSSSPSESLPPSLHPDDVVCPIQHNMLTPPNSSPSVSPPPSEVDPPTQIWPPDSRKRPSKANCSNTVDSKKKCVPKGKSPLVTMEVQSVTSLSEKQEIPLVTMEAESVSSEEPLTIEPPVTLEEGQCSICYEDSKFLISCSQCASQFDCGCLGITHLPSPPFVCSECTVAATQCFFCKSVEGDLTTCSHKTCTRQYHLACVRGRQGFVFKSGAMCCPVHSCVRCQLTPEETRQAPRAPLVSCTHCLLTLHAHPSCLVAGCELTGPRTMICYRHLQRRGHVGGRGQKVPSHINLDWCYLCGVGGLLLCCDTCATAYHAACVGDEGECGDAEQWVCPDCQRHNLLTYGGLAWCKCGTHKWWPCEVLPQKQVPEHLLKMKPADCMFLVRFFGTGEHWWAHHGRCVRYHLPDQGSSSSSGERKNEFVAKAGSKTEAFLKKALQEVAERALLVSHQEKTSKKYIHLKSNKYLVPCPPPSYGVHLEMCQCNEEHPCEDESRCVNRASKIECSKQTCRLGDQCCNRRLRNADYAPCIPFYTGKRGWGLKAVQPITAGAFVVEYVGEVIDEGMCRDRLQRYHEEGRQSFYILSLAKGLYIDAAAKANKARFINHSCQPNLETQKWMVDGKTRIGLFSLANIPAGTELTFDYQLDSLGHSKMPCHCGAPNCSGLLGEKVKALHTQKGKAPNKKKGGKRRRKVTSTAV